MSASRSSPTDRATMIARIGAVLALLAAVAGVNDLAGAWTLSNNRAVAESQRLAIARGDRVAADVTPPGSGGSPRALLYDALVRARSASLTSSDTRRQMLLDRAGNDVARAERRRPAWAEAALLDGYVASLRGGGDSQNRVRDALARSYRAAPFLHDGGAWRVQQGFARWAAMPADVRVRVVDEAVWLGRLSADVRPQIFDLARASPGYRMFSLRWIESRRGDGDLVAPQRAAP